jgi:hypothetical protein
MKYGFELEAFIFHGRESVPCLVPNGLPYDECGWLVEIRSEPNEDITNALYLLRAETEKVEAKANALGYTLVYKPLLEVPRDLKVQASRKHGKGLINYRNIYGFETHRNSTKLQTASLHVSVTNKRTFNYDTVSEKGVVHRNNLFPYREFIDHAKLISTLDREFKKEILDAKRNPGFYEVKCDGRIEYRSLPNTVSLQKLGRVLKEIKLD